MGLRKKVFGKIIKREKQLESNGQMRGKELILDEEEEEGARCSYHHVVRGPKRKINRVRSGIIKTENSIMTCTSNRNVDCEISSKQYQRRQITSLIVLTFCSELFYILMIYTEITL